MSVTFLQVKEEQGLNVLTVQVEEGQGLNAVSYTHLRAHET